MIQDNKTLLEVKDLKKHFPIRKGVFKKIVGNVRAVDGVSFSIDKGKTLGLVGESGCGKSTTGRCLLRLLEPSFGDILFRDDGQVKNILNLDKKEMKKIRRNIQIIFQDPYSSLDSRMSVRDIIAEPLRVQRIGNRKARTEMVKDLLEKVGLRAYQMNRYPHEFSGGQRQRIGIARALALNPQLIICDEPVSALDVSVQAQVINLLKKLQQDFALTYLFIAHDLSVVEHISDRILVMYLGKIVETADSDSLFNQPRHPYTEALLAAIPTGDPRAEKERLPLEGSVPNPANPPSGCNFHTRCPYAEEICRKEEPGLVKMDGLINHFAACHFSSKLNLLGYEEIRSKNFII